MLRSHRARALTFLASLIALPATVCLADGKVQPPRKYKGSLEERAQEALIVFKQGRKRGESVEDLILKIRVAGDVDNFAWIVPFPQKPKVKEADAKLFTELFNYVDARRRRRSFKSKSGAKSEDNKAADGGVRVLSREVVGSYDIAVVEETKAGALNGWLEANDYQPLADAAGVLESYREKKYVFACIKVDEAQLRRKKIVDLHPLRFTFKTGGLDGIYFPMKLTGLQSEPFDVNLYVMYRYWLNDSRSKFGYEHRGFRLKYRDWDSPECKPDAGKSYTAPRSDPFLKGYAHHIPTLSAFLQATNPGERFYLTNIAANGLKPERVREWPDDLWLFPYYTNRAMVPHDARPGGVAAEGWQNQKVDEDGNDPDVATFSAFGLDLEHPLVTLAIGVVAGVMLAGGFFLWKTRLSRKRTVGDG